MQAKNRARSLQSVRQALRLRQCFAMVLRVFALYQTLHQMHQAARLLRRLLVKAVQQIGVQIGGQLQIQCCRHLIGCYGRRGAERRALRLLSHAAQLVHQNQCQFWR